MTRSGLDSCDRRALASAWEALNAPNVVRLVRKLTGVFALRGPDGDGE